MQLSFLELDTKKFQQILPISHQFDGTISGGGNFIFSGISYTEFLNSLQAKAKFVVHKTKIPKFNLNFLAKNLLKHIKIIFLNLTKNILIIICIPIKTLYTT